jgi:hypothetical protein
MLNEIKYDGANLCIRAGWQILVNTMMKLRSLQVKFLISSVTLNFLKITQFQDDFTLFNDRVQTA